MTRALLALLALLVLAACGPDRRGGGGDDENNAVANNANSADPNNASPNESLLVSSSNPNPRVIAILLPPPGFSMDSDEIEILNGGAETLQVTELAWEADETGYINPRASIPETPFDIEPGQQLNLRFRLAVPSSAESDVPLMCPEPPLDLPADIPGDRYCGRLALSAAVLSEPPAEESSVLYLLVEPYPDETP